MKGQDMSLVLAEMEVDGYTVSSHAEPKAHMTRRGIYLDDKLRSIGFMRPMEGSLSEFTVSFPAELMPDFQPGTAYRLVLEKV